VAKPPQIKAGADSKRAEVSRELLSLYLTEVRRHLEPLLREHSVDHVHDMRVAVRRLRAAMRVLDDKARTLRAQEAGLKVLQDALGEVRDLDVEIAWYLEGGLGVEGVEPEGLDALVQQVQAQLPPREAQLVEALRVFQRETSPLLQEAVRKHAPPGRLGGKQARKALEKRIRRVEKAAGALDARMEAGPVHALRIAAKKLRYTAEPLLAAFPHLEALLDELASLQKLLGELHDADVRRERLISLARAGRRGPARKVAFTLEAAVSAERTGLAQKAARELKRWKKEKVLRALEHEVT